MSKKSKLLMQTLGIASALGGPYTDIKVDKGTPDGRYTPKRSQVIKNKRRKVKN